MILNSEIKSLIALAANGSTFTEYAVHRILDQIHLNSGLKREVCFWMLVSAIRRHDYRCAEMYIKDWTDPFSKPQMNVVKFVPGHHWHVLGERFNNENDAVKYLESNGYRFAGTRFEHLPKEGD